MKLTCVTATFNCIKAGNRERLVRCIESVAKLKTEHEHLIYDGASTDGTVELFRSAALDTSRQVEIRLEAIHRIKEILLPRAANHGRTAALETKPSLHIGV